MAARFWQRWGLAVIVAVTVMLVLITPFKKICSCSCQTNDCKCKKDMRVRDIIIYDENELQNLTQKVEMVHKHRAEDALLREEFLDQIEQERKLREEISDLRQAIKFGLSNAAKLQLNTIRNSGWTLDCITWEKKWEIQPLDSEPHNFTVEGVSDAHESDFRRQETFEKIFDLRDWPAKDPSYSGLQASEPGAKLQNAQGIIAALHVIVIRLKESLGKPYITLLDIACGDFQWMSRFLVTRTDILYTGADIVPGIIEHHKKKFATLPRTEFIQWDIVKTPLNESYDLILCRDMLQHLYQGDAMQALQHISQSRSSYVLVTTFPSATQNNLEIDKEALGGRKVSYNLELPPFLLEPPICMSYDWNVEHVALWPLPLKQKYNDLF